MHFLGARSGSQSLLLSFCQASNPVGQYKEYKEYNLRAMKSLWLVLCLSLRAVVAKSAGGEDEGDCLTQVVMVEEASVSK